MGCVAVALTLGLPASSAIPSPLFLYPKSYETGGGAWSVAAGDVNHDGKPDLAVTNYGTVSVLINKGDGRFQLKVDYPTGSDPYTVALADLNGDGTASRIWRARATTSRARSPSS